MTISQFHVMTYYGDNPTLIFGLPLYALVQNGALALVGGWTILVAAPRLPGMRKLFLALLVPLSFGLQAFITTWPMYLGLNTGASRSSLFIRADRHGSQSCTADSVHLLAAGSCASRAPATGDRTGRDRCVGGPELVARLPAPLECGADQCKERFTKLISARHVHT